MLRDTSSVSGLTVTTMTVSPTKREPPFGAGTPGGGFLFLRMVNLTFGIPDLSIPDSPQKSSAVQKVYRAGLAAEGRPVFVQPLRRCAPAPLVGEPLAKPFTLRGLPKPPLPGEVARRRRDGEVVRRKACPRTRPMTERFTPKRYSLYTDTSLVYPESMIK